MRQALFFGRAGRAQCALARVGAQQRVAERAAPRVQKRQQPPRCPGRQAQRAHVAVLAEGLDSGGLGKLIDGIGTAFGMVLGLVGCGAIMLFLAMVSGMKAVSPV